MLLRGGTPLRTGSLLRAGSVTSTTTPPTAPSTVTATALSSTSIQVAWSGGTTGNVTWTVERSLTGAGSWTSVGTGLTSSPFTDTGLTIGTTYYYRVTAVSTIGGGSSSPSSTASATTTATAPTAPTTVSATSQGASSIRIAWSGGTTANVTWTIERSANGTTGWTSVATGLAASPYDDTALSESTTYYYRVTAVSTVGGGSSSPSSVVNATTGATVPVIPPVSLPATNARGTTFRVFNLDTGAYLGEVVDLIGIKASFEYSAVGSFTCDYPLVGRFASLLDIDIEIVAYYDGVEVRNGRWVIRGKSGEATSDNGGAVSIAGLSHLDLLRKVIIYTPTTFSAATPGGIIKALLTTATARGAFGATAITTTTFSNTLDSKGAAWANTLSITYDTGTTYRQIVEALFARGLIDFEFNGRDLRVYNGNTMGSNKDLVLAAGRHVIETPFKMSTEDRANVVLVEGDDGVITERTATGPRREESFTQQSGVNNISTLNVIGDLVLAGSSVIADQRTIKIADASPIKPLRDFVVGDFVIYDDGRNPTESVRVRQIVLEVDHNGNEGYSCVLNDMILEGDVKRAIQLSAIAGGVGGGTTGSTSDPITSDTTIPSAPTSVSVTTATYLETNGTIYGQATVSWPTVTTNTDGSSIADLDHYEVQYKSNVSFAQLPANQFSPINIVPAGTTTAYFGPLKPGSIFTAQVRAMDSFGHASSWTSSTGITVVSDATPPTAPSTPAVSPFFRGIRVVWNGLDNTGAAMAGDFDHLDVHYSTTSNFTPTTATKADSYATRGGVTPINDLVYGTTYFVKLIAYDTTGNASAASAQASATPQQLVTGDVPTTFITNAMIANLAVDDAKIAAVSAGKITVGTLIADITLSARIKTANTGARVELNSGGMFGYSASANTFSLSTTGSLWMSGTLESGTMSGGIADFPRLVDSAAARTHMDSNGFRQTNDGTTNLVTNPSLESQTGMTVAAGTTLETKGAATVDIAANIDQVPMYGKGALKVYNSTASGWVRIPVGSVLSPSTQYTFSFHCSTTRINDNNPGGQQPTYALFDQIQIQELTTGAVRNILAQGTDTKYVVDGPSPGVISSAISSGLNQIGTTGWSTRWSKTFTTPSTISGSSSYIIQLPAPRTSSNGNETVYAIVYDALQIEVKPYATRYCDGDQYGCTWSGTAHASTSTRPNDLPSAVFPGYGEPQVRGKLRAPDIVVSNTIKKGAGAPQGTNYIQTVSSVSQSIPQTTWTSVVFNNIDSSRTVADDGPILAGQYQHVSQVYGMYGFSATLSYASSGVGVFRAARWITQGSTIIAQGDLNRGWNMAGVSGMYVLPGAGYWIRVDTYHDAGANLDINADGAGSPCKSQFALLC